MDFTLWLAFVAASTALLLIPGPTVLLVLSYALSQGRKIAVATALGVATGDLIAMTASLLGLGALVLASATAFMVLKWIGAIYLVWLGVLMLRGAASAQLGQVERTRTAPKGVFRHAALVTALNPKSIGFFIAFVPQFLDPAHAIAPQAAILIATFVTLAGVNALAYALLADRLRRRIERPAVIRGLTRGGGIALIGMGAATAMMRRTV